MSTKFDVNSIECYKVFKNGNMIQRVSSLCWTTKNPFNIRYSKEYKWKGFVTIHKGFCVFESFRYGVRAGIILLRNYIRNGYNTVESIVSRYAPPSENNTRAYIEFVDDRVNFGKIGGSSSDTPIKADSLEFFWLVSAIACYESGYNLSWDEFQTIVKSFNISLK